MRHSYFYIHAWLLQLANSLVSFACARQSAPCQLHGQIDFKYQKRWRKCWSFHKEEKCFCGNRVKVESWNHFSGHGAIIEVPSHYKGLLQRLVVFLCFLFLKGNLFQASTLTSIPSVKFTVARRYATPWLSQIQIRTRQLHKVGITASCFCDGCSFGRNMGLEQGA